MMIHLLLQFILVTAGWVRSQSNANIDESKESIKSPLVNDNIVNVHLISHTHDDPGWLKTVDQYYYGTNSSIYNAGVQYILDTVIQALIQNSNRKFVYVEMSFFQRWYEEQTMKMRRIVKMLVKNGQLSFANGGWVMHDEATCHFTSMIDQTTLGHRFLYNEFQIQPTIGWQIDPFGHSSTQASLLSTQVGFDALYFGRIDYQDLLLRSSISQQNLEFLWNPTTSLLENKGVFTGVFSDGNYSPPPGFCFDIRCPTTYTISRTVSQSSSVGISINDDDDDDDGKESIISVRNNNNHIIDNNLDSNKINNNKIKNRKLTHPQSSSSSSSSSVSEQREQQPMMDNHRDPIYNNIDFMLQQFISVLENEKSKTKGRNIGLRMGSDFHYTNADMWYKNIDKLIYYMNLRHADKYKVFYSNPTIYTQMKAEEEIEWSVKTDDFFPYADCPHCYWTGYFTSRPTLKYFERQSASFLQALKQMSVTSFDLFTSLSPTSASVSISTSGTMSGREKDDVFMSDGRRNDDDDDDDDDEVRLTQHPLFSLTAAVSLMNHHDAMTGTSKQHVADDYMRILDRAMTEGEEMAALAIQYFLFHDTHHNDDDDDDDEVKLHSSNSMYPQPKHRHVQICRLMNESICPFTQNIDIDMDANHIIPSSSSSSSTSSSHSSSSSSSSSLPIKEILNEFVMIVYNPLPRIQSRLVSVVLSDAVATSDTAVYILAATTSGTTTSGPFSSTKAHMKSESIPRNANTEAMNTSKHADISSTSNDDDDDDGMFGMEYLYGEITPPPPIDITTATANDNDNHHDSSNSSSNTGSSGSSSKGVYTLYFIASDVPALSTKQHIIRIIRTHDNSTSSTSTSTAINTNDDGSNDNDTTTTLSSSSSTTTTTTNDNIKSSNTVNIDITSPFSPPISSSSVTGRSRRPIPAVLLTQTSWSYNATNIAGNKLPLFGETKATASNSKNNADNNSNNGNNNDIKDSNNNDNNSNNDNNNSGNNSNAVFSISNGCIELMFNSSTGMMLTLTRQSKSRSMSTRNKSNSNDCTSHKSNSNDSHNSNSNRNNNNSNSNNSNIHNNKSQNDINNSGSSSGSSNSITDKDESVPVTISSVMLDNNDDDDDDVIRIDFRQEYAYYIGYGSPGTTAHPPGVTLTDSDLATSNTTTTTISKNSMTPPPPPLHQIRAQQLMKDDRDPHIQNLVPNIHVAQFDAALSTQASGAYIFRPFPLHDDDDGDGDYGSSSSGGGSSSTGRGNDNDDKDNIENNISSSSGASSNGSHSSSSDTDTKQRIDFPTSSSSHPPLSLPHHPHHSSIPIENSLNQGVSEISIIQGVLISEVRQTYTNWIYQVIRLQAVDTEYIDFEWSVGPIPLYQHDANNHSDSDSDNHSSSDNHYHGKNDNHYDFNDEAIGKEIISRFLSRDIQNMIITDANHHNNHHSDRREEGVVDDKQKQWTVLYTDSNGREFQKRIKNYRPTWNLTVTEPIAGNYYPVTTAAYIRTERECLPPTAGEETNKMKKVIALDNFSNDMDTNTKRPSSSSSSSSSSLSSSSRSLSSQQKSRRRLQLSVLTDRAQGAASLNRGELEFMIHRRLVVDDSRGVEEALNETTTTTTRATISSGNGSSSSSSTPASNTEPKKDSNNDDDGTSNSNKNRKSSRHHQSPPVAATESETVVTQGLVVKGKHRVIVSMSGSHNCDDDDDDDDDGEGIFELRREMDKLYNPFVVFYSPLSSSSQQQLLPLLPHQYEILHRAFPSPLGYDLPLNIQLITLERWNKNTILLRLGHAFAMDEKCLSSSSSGGSGPSGVGSNMSAPVIVDIRKLLFPLLDRPNINNNNNNDKTNNNNKKKSNNNDNKNGDDKMPQHTVSISEMSLSANQLRSEMLAKRIKWKSVADYSNRDKDRNSRSSTDSSSITSSTDISSSSTDSSSSITDSTSIINSSSHIDSNHHHMDKITPTTTTITTATTTKTATTATANTATSSTTDSNTVITEAKQSTFLRGEKIKFLKKKDEKINGPNKRDEKTVLFVKEAADNWIITISPMEVRTFFIKLS